MKSFTNEELQDITNGAFFSIVEYLEELNKIPLESFEKLADLNCEELFVNKMAILEFIKGYCGMAKE